VESKAKEWLDLYAKMSENISDLVIILDTSFEIIYSNHKAASFFLIDDYSITLDQVFDNETAKTLTEEVSQVLFAYQKKTINNFRINLKSENRFEYNLIIAPIDITNDKLLFLIFSEKGSGQAQVNIDQIQINSSKRFLLQQDKTVKSLIEQVQQFVPFTVVGLRALQVIIDKYDFPIWILDNESKFITINKDYSNNLGVEISVTQGKKQQTFLPIHLASVYKSLNEYILSASNPIILEGITKKANFPDVKESIILIPITDNRNKPYAIIGLINDKKESKIGKNEDLLIEKKFIENFPKPVALLNFNGIIEQANQDFCKFLGKDWENIINKNFIDLFPYLFSENIKSFLSSELPNDEIFLDNDFSPVDVSTSIIVVSLLKISSAVDEKRYFLILVEKQKELGQEKNELQNFIKNRGKMFDILIQKNPEPIFIYDKENLKFLEVNDSAIKFYGFSRDEFLQMDLTDLYAPEDIQTLLNSFDDEALEGKFSKPFRHRKKDGSTVVVEISKTSFLFNDREAHFNIVKDISSNVAIDAQNQMLKVIFNSSDLLVFTTDSEGFITYINYPVIEKLGFTSNDLMKSSFASLVSDEDRGMINTNIFQANLKDEISFETLIKKSDGEFLTAQITASPILDFNKEIESFTIIVKPSYDISSPEKPKEIIKEVVKEVFVEKKLESSEKQNVPDINFISGIFHEILTPMNVIIGFAQELVTGLENPTEEQKETAEIINQNRVKMMNTMNAISEYSEILQNKLVLKPEGITITDVIDVLDKKINEITGLNDIQFGYGKISSSLSFKTDRQKFENFIFYLIKVIARISKDKKVYFSAYPIDSDTFFIGLSDQYGGSSVYVANTFELIFNEDKDPKDFGLPKLSTYLAKVLLTLLGGKYYKSVVGSLRKEAGFLFPQTLLLKEGKYYTEFAKEGTSSESDKEKFETIMPVEVESETEAEERQDMMPDFERPASEDLKEPVSTEVQDENIFKTDNEETESEPEIEAEEFEADSSERDAEMIGTEENKNVTAEEEVVEVQTPQVKEETESSFEPHLQTLNLKDLSCLYIEDQVDSQILFKVQMKELKDVKFAVSFEESQPMLLNHQFDFIVMDINLQGEYNGLDALKIIKTMPALSHIPIIAVTAYVLPGDKEKFIAAGFDDFISKPIFREKMMESLEKIFLSK
jgi:PAS domain S-box-containing protein